MVLRIINIYLLDVQYLIIYFLVFFISIVVLGQYFKTSLFRFKFVSFLFKYGTDSGP